MGRVADGRTAWPSIRLRVDDRSRTRARAQLAKPVRPLPKGRWRLGVAIATLSLAAPTAAAASEPAYSQAPGSPLSTTANGGAGLAFSPAGNLLADGTAIYSVGASGALTPVPGAAPDSTARAVAFSPSGTLLAAANESSHTVSMFTVAAAGTLKAVSGSPFTLGGQPTSVAFSPNGQLLEVSAGESLYVFTVSAAGVLKAATGSPHSVKATGHAAFNPAGNLLAVPGSAGVSMFTVSTSGVLTAVAGSPFSASGQAGEAAVFATGGKVLSVAGFGSKGEQLSTYSVAASGALTTVGGGEIQATPTEAAFSPSGGMVATTGYDNSAVHLHSIGATGALAEVQALTNPDPVTSIAIAANGTIATEGLSHGPLAVFVPSSSSSGTNWVGAFGSEGYDLAGWNGESDASYLPDASVSLVHGSRETWANPTSDTRALEGPTGSSRIAAGYYDPKQVEVKLTFRAAYTGNLRLYAVYWGDGGSKENESLKVGASSAVIFSNNPDQGSQGFSDGQWAIFPISVAAGGSVTIVVNGEGWPSGAVLSGIFLGDTGAPPGAPTISTSPQGTWTGTFGASGYDLAGWDGSTDVSDMGNATLSLVQGSRYVWTPQTEEARALESPDGLTREAATYFDSNELEFAVKFTAAYTGNLRLYAVDWDSTARRETITVNGQTATLSSSFNQGAWVTFPISVAAGAAVTVTVERTAGANAVISGVFLGDAGAPPTIAATSAPQGGWVGTYGSAGYGLGAWNGESDVADMPNASLSLAQGSRYVWAPKTSDVRALENPNTLTREAATYYDPNQLRLALKFTTAYTGNLRLYALDWDSTARRETISVNGRTADLSSSFNQGAWVTFPISAAAGETVTIVVDRTAGANAVISGVFLGEAGSPPGPAPQGTLIPLYDNANPADWTEACSQTNGSGGGSLIIADAAEGSGPGSARLPAWASVIENCLTYGRASVIGYVWTDYGEGGTASIAGIESEVNAWYSYYPGDIAGIFFDGVSDEVPGTSTSNQSFYETLANYVHTHEGSGAQVVFNFGANPGSAWMLSGSAANNATLIVTFEGSYDTPGEDPYTAWTPAPWEASYPAKDFAALVYNAPEALATPQPASACGGLAKQNVGYVYVGTWYSQLPPYFGSFLNDSFSGSC
jgi:WD40 repeat protein